MVRARLLAALSILSSSGARAIRRPGDEDQALPCRPTIACTADLVPPGDVELEVGYAVRRGRAGVAQQSTPFLLKLTIARWIQLQLGGGGGTFVSGDKATRYLDDLALGVKLHLQSQRGAVPSLSVSVALSAPTFEAPDYLRTWDLLAAIYVTRDFGRLHVDLNLGLNALRLEGAPLLQPWIALALSFPLPRRLGGMVELYGFGDGAPVAPADGGLLAALTWSPRPWLVFDLGGDLGLAAARTITGFAGATIVPFGLAHRPRGGGVATGTGTGTGTAATGGEGGRRVIRR